MSVVADVNYAAKIAKKSFTHVMRHKRFSASLMQTRRLVDTGSPHQLPPGNKVPVFPVDSLPGCPEDWIRGMGSFVCPVDPNWGLWFDFTMNDALNTAILLSVKGMNPVTGRKLEGLSLEKYEEKCPVHDEAFKGELFCEKCNFKWPPQSYVCSPNTLWWDGFRQADGTVRQFFFTADDERDIASAVIGKQNTVPAFGFAFYEPVKRREAPRSVLRSCSPKFGFGGVEICSGGSSGEYSLQNQGPSQIMYASHHEEEQKTSVMNFDGDDGPRGFKGKSAPIMASSLRSKKSMMLCKSSEPEQDVEMASSLRSKKSMMLCKSSEPEQDVEKKVSVGAGAQIYQDLIVDPLATSDWKSEQSSIIRLYFVFRKQFEKIFDKGVTDLEGDKDGYLKGLPVG